MNSLKRYRVGRRELPFSVLRRAAVMQESTDWADWEPTPEERSLDDLEEAEEDFWNMLAGAGWCDGNCGCAGD